MRVEGIREALKGAKALKNKMQPTAGLALNRVGEGVITEANRKVRETYNIKAADVKSTLRIVYSSPDDGEVIIKGSGPNLPLPTFKVTPKTWNYRKPKGVKVAVRRGDAKAIKSAYIRANDGKVRVMTRVHPTGQGPKREKNAKGDYPELPVKELRGTAVPVMLNEPQVIKHVQSEAKDRMRKRMDHEVKRLLGGFDS
ncbi:phage tail protein [Paenibacillus sp. 2TAB19]|uniref:phage tail protein n=1 Tax=Paenibacillus sp. 2TAB19 TaxID=3233003 RepID=UPI003F9C15D5